MHYNGPIDIALHPRNQINANLHIKHYVVFPAPGSTCVAISISRSQVWAWGVGSDPQGAGVGPALTSVNYVFTKTPAIAPEDLFVGLASELVQVSSDNSLIARVSVQY